MEDIYADNLNGIWKKNKKKQVIH